MQKIYSNAFTFAGLSIAIVLISVILSAIIVAKSMIDMAKINKIQEEYISIQNGIITFLNQYDCLPGDCRLSQIPDISDNLPTTCTTENTTVSQEYNVFNTSGIESIIKRTCMMFELALSGIFDLSKLSLSYEPLTDSIVDKTIPRSVAIKTAAWDFVTTNRGINVTNVWTYPNEASTTYETIFLSNSLILRAANVLTGISYGSFDFNGGGAIGPLPSVSSKLAQKLDSKFDDGNPYTGYIIGTITNASWNRNDPSSNISCSTIKTSTPTSLSAISYLNSDDIIKGCVVVYNIVIK